MRAGETELVDYYYCIQDKRMSEPGERKKRQHNTLTHTHRQDRQGCREMAPTHTNTNNYHPRKGARGL
jgi:hypothetical protein